ncbi:hypothetical protein BKA70DRAFT_483738 [Coprinopsis sp. MPI-PUGE-AT-0042]|nr:hypothetical protein BKA70DRAFT_483738 [Coprinopsis sp. MPI-PUGE-AT-0042]
MASSSSHVPQWPALYNPGVEILNITNNEPTQPEGEYLYRTGDVFRFTFYWTIIFYTPLFLACGFYAFWNYTFPPSPSERPRRLSTHKDSGTYELVAPSPTGMQHPASPPGAAAPSKLPRVNERRSRVAFAVIVLFVFLFATLAGAVVGSILLSLITTGLYRAGHFHMSTWIPFLLALIQALIGFLSIWPSIIEIV